MQLSRHATAARRDGGIFRPVEQVVGAARPRPGMARTRFTCSFQTAALSERGRPRRPRRSNSVGRCPAGLSGHSGRLHLLDTEVVQVLTHSSTSSSTTSDGWSSRSSGSTGAGSRPRSIGSRSTGAGAGVGTGAPISSTRPSRRK